MHIPAPTRAESAPVTPSPHPASVPAAAISRPRPHPNPGPISHRTRRKLGSPFLKAIDSTILIGFVRTKKISHPNPPHRTIKHKSAQPTTQHPAPARDARLPPRYNQKHGQAPRAPPPPRRGRARCGEDRQNRQHKEGKLSARERIELLLDEGT